MDGVQFVSEALARGAIAIASSHPRPADVPKNVTWIELGRGRERRALARAGSNFYNQPSKALKLVGITGTNGKTTTTALTGHILQTAGTPVQVGGNIGTPVIAMTETSRVDQWNVLELSSFQLETIRGIRAHVGVCLNVTQNHLDRHHTFENYVAAKAKISPIVPGKHWHDLTEVSEATGLGPPG